MIWEPLARHSTRRRFISLCALLIPGLFADGAPGRGLIRRISRGKPHPTPRPGITAERVVAPEQLTDLPDAAEVFDMVREMPQIIDGIRCSCGCADRAGFYSLLSCFEGDGMARHCHVCRNQVRLAAQLFHAGKSLDEIRTAIDARYP